MHYILNHEKYYKLLYLIDPTVLLLNTKGFYFFMRFGRNAAITYLFKDLNLRASELMYINVLNSILFGIKIYVIIIQNIYLLLFKIYVIIIQNILIYYEHGKVVPL